MLSVKPAVKAFVMCGTIRITPTNRSSPVAMSPHPTVIAPYPISAHPNITGRRAGGRHLHHGSWHWRWNNDWSRSRNHRNWSCDNRHRDREAKVDTDTNPGVYRGDSQGRQGQNCDSLFHNLYRFDAMAEQSMLTNRLRFCKARSKTHILSTLGTLTAEDETRNTKHVFP